MATRPCYLCRLDPALLGRGHGSARRDPRHHLRPEQLQRAQRLGVGDVAPLERTDEVVYAGLERVLLNVPQDRVWRADDAAFQLERLLDVTAQARAAGRQRLD